MNNKHISQALFTLIIASSTGVVLAGTATTNFDVTANVAANCTIAATLVGFGPYDPVSTNVTGTPLTYGGGAVKVTCTKGATATIGLGPGNNVSAAVRRMKGINVSNFLTYELYKPSDNLAGTQCTTYSGTVWNVTNTLTTVPAPSNAERSYSICGSVAGGQDVAVDSYSDIVMASVSF